MTKKPTKPIWEMSAGELAEETCKYDSEIPESKRRPLSPRGRLMHDLASGIRVPADQIQAVYGGAETSTARPKRVTIELDADLLRESDDCARQQGLSRSELIARSLRSSLAFFE